MPVVRALAAQIRIGLGEPAVDVARRAATPEIGTRTLRALQLFGEGMALLDLDSADRWEIARAYFNQAIREDPDFALAYAYRSWTAPSPERLADSERAFQLADRVDERARLFIRGTYFSQRNREADAATEYARLVQLAPHDYWAVNNLAFAYQRTKAHAKSIPFFIRRAQLRPTSVTANYGMVVPLTIIGQFAQAAHYAELARDVGMAHPPEGGQGREQLAAAELFPVRLAWREGDMAKVAAKLLEIRKRLDNHPARWELVDAMLNWYTSLGRLRDADDLALQQADARSSEKPAPSSDLDPTDLALAWDAYYRGDNQSARDHLARLYTQLPPSEQSFRAIILMARVGMTAQAEAIVKAPHEPDVAFSPPYLAYYDAEIALAQRRPADVVKQLDTGCGGPPVMCELALAAAYEARGDLKAALAALEHANRGQANWPYWLPALGAEWLQLRATESRVLRKLGRAGEAEQLEGELRPLLAVADDGHPIAAYLNSMKGK